MSDLVKYFPVMTPGAIKRRRKQLSETKKTTQDVGTQHPARLEKRSTAAFPAASTSGKCDPKITKLYHATSGLPATGKLAKPCSNARQRRDTRQANHTKVAIPSALPNFESTPQRSSRCG